MRSSVANHGLCYYCLKPATQFEDWDPIKVPGTPEMLDILEEIIRKIEIASWIDDILPLTDEGQEAFLKRLGEDLREANPVVAKILEPYGFDAQKVDTNAWLEKIETARQVIKIDHPA